MNGGTYCAVEEKTLNQVRSQAPYQMIHVPQKVNALKIIFFIPEAHFFQAGLNLSLTCFRYNKNS